MLNRGKKWPNLTAILAWGFLAMVVFAAVLPVSLTSYDPNRLSLADNLQPPSAQHWMGTDKFGRDILSRLLYGARVSLIAGVIAQSISLLIGLVLGACAGYYQGTLTDHLISFLMTVIWAFPFILLVIAVTAALGPGITQVYTAIGVTNWVGIARVVRGEFIALREREYVVASVALGADMWRVIFRHIFPNALPPIIVTTMLGFADVITAESGLSFLGLGVQPPTASWGAMIRTGTDYLTTAWWQAFFPGSVLVLTIVSLNLIGDRLNDRFRLGSKP